MRQEQVSGQVQGLEIESAKPLRTACHPSFVATAVWAAAVLTASSVSIDAKAQQSIPYKVIGADGRVTYTDRPALDSGRVTPVTASTGAPVATASAPLPLELRQAVARYPVTVYLADADCQPCVAARQLLQQRGVPYSERQVSTAEDGQALERLSGGRDLPTLAIGAQLLRGLAPEVWTSYLDAAGYPRESRLPAGYQYPPATPLVARSRASPASAPSSSELADAPTIPNLPNASGIRF